MIARRLTQENNTACHFRKTAGFTLFELAVVGIIVAVLAGVLVKRLTFYQEQVELARVEQTVGIMRAALQFKVSRLVVVNKEHEFSRIVDENPIEWLVERPKNYLGEYYSPQVNMLPKGNWYYDRSDKSLNYLLDNGKSFTGKQWNLLKFKVKFGGLPPKPAKLPGPSPVIEGVVLEQVFDHSPID